MSLAPPNLGLGTLVSASVAAVAVALGASALIENIAFQSKLEFPCAVSIFVPSWYEFLRVLGAPSMSTYLNDKLDRFKKKGVTLFYVRATLIFPTSRPNLVVVDPKDQAEVMRQEGKAAMIVDMPDTVQMIHGKFNMQNIHGDQHKKIRKLFGSLLSPRSLEGFLPVIVQYFHQMWDDLETKCRDLPAEEKVIILDSIRETQFLIVCDVLFGLKRSDSDQMRQKIDEIGADCELQLTALFSMPWTSTFKEGKAGADRNHKYLRAKLAATIEARRANNGTVPPLPINNALDAIADSLLEGKLSEDKEMDELIHDNLLLLLEASHGTTMTVTTSILYYLHHPDNAEALKKVKDELNKAGDKLELAKFMNELPYCHACIQEAMRLAPIVTQIGYVMPKGNNIQLRGKTMHGPMSFRLVFDTNSKFNADLFPSPSEFIPERWLPESSHPMVAGKEALAASHPFGMGRHLCLGQKLAFLMMKANLFCLYSKPRGIEYDPSSVYVIENVFPMNMVKDGLPGRVVAI